MWKAVWWTGVGKRRREIARYCTGIADYNPWLFILPKDGHVSGTQAAVRVVELDVGLFLRSRHSVLYTTRHHDGFSASKSDAT